MFDFFDIRDKCRKSGLEASLMGWIGEIKSGESLPIGREREEMEGEIKERRRISSLPFPSISFNFLPFPLSVSTSSEPGSQVPPINVTLCGATSICGGIFTEIFVLRGCCYAKPGISAEKRGR